MLNERHAGEFDHLSQIVSLVIRAIEVAMERKFIPEEYGVYPKLKIS